MGGTIQPYHHTEAVLWKAEGCFWTSRFMEITDQRSDWQATDCMGLRESSLMGADGFLADLVHCVQADCIVISSSCIFFSYLHCTVGIVICH